MTGRSIEQRVELSLTPAFPGSLSVKTVLSIPDQVTGLEITVPTVSTDVTVTGITRTDDITYQWDGQTTRPQIELIVPENAPSEDPHGGVYVADAGTWAVVEAASAGSASWQYRGTDPGFERTVHVSGNGVVSPDGAIAYLGPHNKYRNTTGSQTTGFVVPTASNLTPHPSTVVATLNAAAEEFKVGTPSSEVLAVALPTTMTDWGALGRQTGDNGFWVRADAPMNTPNNTWLHEYVHTRQSFEWTNETRWLVEATANYYAGRLAFNLGYAELSSFRNYVDTERDANAVLSAPSQWSSRHTPYCKGRRVLAALDRRIRIATGGSKSFDDVFRRINSTNNLAHNDFVNIVNSVTDNSNQQWLNQYIGSTPSPAITSEFGETIDSTREPVGSRELTEGEYSGSTPTKRSGNTDSEKSTKCPACEAVVPDDCRYCRKCGHEAGVTPDSRDTNDASAPGDYCPVCDTMIELPAAYCPNCGTTLSPTCPVCGTRGDPDTVYCSNCGHQFQSSEYT